ncbi:unnamed protein product, partial [Mesorhabditis belari]|uniref:guanylate cyclase n=1 Tax=Mesorhabditis belari TaxID=2138241 RepID=A0AAF3EUL7_9BILA
MRMPSILRILLLLLSQENLFVKGLDGWEILADSPRNLSKSAQQWEVLDGKTIDMRKDEEKQRWEIVDANSTKPPMLKVDWEVMDATQEQFSERYRIKNLCPAGLVPFLEDKRGIPRSCNDNSFEYACPMRDAKPWPAADRPKMCTLADLSTCPNSAQCMPSSVAGTTICCERSLSEVRSFSAIGTEPSKDEKEESCPPGWTPYNQEKIICSPSKASPCPGKSACLRAASTQTQHICCSPGSVTVPFFGDRCPVNRSRIELINGAPRRCSAYSPECSDGYTCQLSYLRKHMLCCSTTVRAQQPAQLQFTCPQIGQTPVVSQQGNNVFCSNAGQRDVCPINSLCVSAANSQGLLICCFSSPTNVQPICPNNGQPQPSLGGSFVACDITNPICNTGFTCVRASNDFQTTLCCAPGTNPSSPICPNQQTVQLTNGQPTFCNPSIISGCSTGFTCTQAANMAGTFICCSAAGISTCPANFSPSLDNLGNQIFCTPTNTAGCPGGSQCLQSPNNPAFFLCCRSTIAPRVCPNGQSALLGPNGNLVSCTGPGAPCSQPNYICTLSPVLAQYYCCGVSTQVAVCADGRETYQQISGSTYSCSPLQVPTGCPIGYDCAQSSVLGTYVCCRTIVTTISPLNQCPSGWNGYRNEVTGESRMCTGPFDMSCPTGYSCTPTTNSFLGGTSSFACCRLATTLRCITGQPLLMNNQPRLCSSQRLNQCPPSYTCQQSTVPSITICCTNIPFPLSRDSSLLCSDGSQPAFVGTSVQYCSDVGVQSTCPSSYLCQQNTSGRNLCCRVRRARIASSKRIEKSGTNDSQWVCGVGTIAQLNGGDPIKCGDDRDCKKRAVCPSGVSLAKMGRTCQNDGDCGENSQCQRSANIPRISLCCATKVPVVTRCTNRETQMIQGRPVSCIVDESLCDRGFECSTKTTTKRSICCQKTITNQTEICGENRAVFYVSPSTEKLLFCDDTGYICPLDFQCTRSPDLDRFVCCSPIPRCPESGQKAVLREGKQIRCLSDKDCPEAMCTPTNFGFIHESIRQLIIRKYGEDLWLQILSRAGFENGKENVVNHYYNDSDTYLLVDSVSAITKLSREQVWEMYGTFLIVYTMELGWDELVRSMSPNLKGFLDSLDSLHYFIDHVVYKANLRGPSFRCEQNVDGTITLHYFTGRPGLYPIVKGVLKEVARCVFNIEISLTITGRTQRSVQTASGGERIEEHVIFLIKTISNTRGEEVPQDAMIGPKVSAVEGEGEPLHMSLSDFSTLLPYHVIFDEDCKLVQVGKELYNHVPKDLLQPGTPIMRMFELTRPQIPFDFDNVCNFINAVFVLQVRTAPTDLRRQREAE